MKGKPFKETKAFAVASAMPPGKNHKPAPEFDWSKSEVSQWLADQPEIRRYLFEKCKDAGAFTYDPNTGTWRGSGSQVENL